MGNGQSWSFRDIAFNQPQTTIEANYSEEL